MRARLAFVLRAKHWQLFSIFMLTMLFAQATVLSDIPATTSPEAFQKTIVPFMAVTFLFMLLLVTWLWSLGRFLWALAPTDIRLDVRRFRLSLIYPLAYVIVFAFQMQRVPMQPPTWIIPLHLVATLCMFYNLYFVAKSLRLAEVRTPISFYDYSGPFFLLWFFPIGIWVIQPRVNRLYALHSNVDV
jgi:hypothetical protein